ncbi:TonB-dependent receptor domain-containing protein [Bowmanella yangjiangensis]|uniref:TonB-dependent receptor n=1 Tax=Bowmanella yangjiangensis TaxID=2811230 RepID=A0ABS3CT18_9ALTE|nr:TonB-dependent receptor [Bowmanella yangjiangensis]MBN7820273.1 TonB-dependent receptor [Bowmanella yangjiangensis]
MKKKLLTLAIQAAVFSSASAMAQQVEVSATQSSNAAQVEQQQVKEVEKIAVTGSRIKRDSFSMSTPMMLMGKEDLVDSGLGELADILVDEIPSISAGSSNTNTQGSVQNTGLSTIDLRDLGTDRTLTLIDGRRAVSNSYSGNYISLATIPAAMVDRVEVITGGASAVYGSDAIAGVVNIITENNKTGFEIDVRGGETTEGGGREFTIDTGYGASFDDDRGYMLAAVTWDRQFGLLAWDRDRSQYESSFDYDAEKMCNANNTIDGDQCMRDITMDDWRERSNDISGGRFEGNAWWYDADNNLKEGFKEERDGYDTYEWDILKIPVDKLASAIKVNYDLTDDLRGTFQIHYAKNKSGRTNPPEGQDYNDDELRINPETGASELIIPGTISPNNPFVPAVIAEMAGRSVTWDRRFDEVGNVITENTRTTIRSAAGLQGTLFDGQWDWEASVGYGKFKQEQRRFNEISITKLALGLDAEYAADGTTIQCADEQARAEGCVPVNIFGINSISPEAADYIRANPYINTDITQFNAQAFMTGDLFEMPAGMVASAFGIEYRRDTQKVDTDVALRGQAITFNDVPPFSGEVKVWEAFGEATLPLLKDATAAKRLDLDLSLRLADYSQKNIDLMASYRAGLLWEPAEGYAIRANYARAQRAPNITELVSPPRGDYNSFSDICDGVTATSTGAGHDACRQEPGVANAIELYGQFTDENTGYSPNAGNENLKEETADTYTLGITAAPSFLENFNIALDYYDISIEDAITSIGNEQILKECYDSSVPFGDGNPFCGEITRDSEGNITQLIQRQFNLAEESSRGYDISMAYKYETESYGNLSFNLNFTHVIERSATYEGNDGLETVEYKGELSSGVFTDRATASVTWRYDDLRIRWKTKYKSSVVDDYDRVEAWNELYAENQAKLDAGTGGVANPETPMYLFYGSYITHDVSASYNLDLDGGMALKLYGGVRNVFGKESPFVPNTGDVVETGDGNYEGEYDGGVGRFAYLGAELKF